MSVGTNIKLFRISQNLKQKELAEKLNKSVQYLSAIENSKKEPSLPLLRKISELLEIPLSMFFWDNMDKLDDENPTGKIQQLLLELVKTTHAKKK